MNRDGQIMILTIMILGGVMIGASAIAGLLTVFQIRESTDITNSTKAIYAADAGTEWSLYKFANPDDASKHAWAGKQTIDLTNDSSFNATTTIEDGIPTLIRSSGHSVNTNRAFELRFGK